MPKILLLANAASPWTRELIRNIHCPLGHRVILASFDPAPERDYEGLNTCFEPLAVNIKGPWGKVCKTVALLRLALKYRRKVDMVVIHCPPNNVQALLISWAVRLMNSRTLTVFWGSDLQAVNDAQAGRLAHIVQCSDCVNISTQEMRLAYNRFFGKRFSPKIYSAKFGSLAFSACDEAASEYTKESSKSFFGLDPAKICVAVGYGGKPSHQHVSAIKALARLTGEEKEKIQMLLHMHGGERGYIEKVKSAADEAGIGYVILPGSYGLKEIAIMRMATDIFLHAQTNDAMSSSIRECLYSGAVLVNPGWIRYPEYQELGIDYISYHDFSDLTAKMGELIRGERKINVQHNREIVREEYSWEAVKGEWVRIFDENIT